MAGCGSWKGAWTAQVVLSAICERPAGGGFCRPWPLGSVTPPRLAALGDERLKCASEQLQAAVTGSLRPIHR